MSLKYAKIPCLFEVYDLGKISKAYLNTHCRVKFMRTKIPDTKRLQEDCKQLRKVKVFYTTMQAKLVKNGTER